MDRKRVHFVYRTTNLVNGKFYIGVHTAWSVEDDYLGSGDRLKRAVFKHGRENFQRVVLWIFDDRDEAYRMEADEVGKCLGDPLCMNIHPGGNGGWTIALQRRLKKHTEDPTWQEEYRRKCGVTTKRLWDDDGPLRIAFDAGRMPQLDRNGKAHSDSTKKKIGTASAISQARSGNSQYGKQWMTNGLEEKKVRPDEVPALTATGWRRGRSLQFGRMVGEKLRSRGMKGIPTGRAWVSNGETVKQVRIEELEELLAAGWRRGKK